MPRGIAELFSQAPCIKLFDKIEVLLKTKGITLELPDTDKVQVWNSEGEMLHMTREELLDSATISDYLIQFWWPEMDEISINLFWERQLSVCDIYIDGLDEYQCKDILDVLISTTLNCFETIGFVFDREELFSEFDWDSFFRNERDVDRHCLQQYGFQIYKKYVIKSDNRKLLNEFKRDYAYLAIPNHKKL